MVFFSICFKFSKIRVSLFDIKFKFMDISRIIQDLIVKNDTVSVNGLGSFARHYNPAEVYKYSGKVTPPSYQLIFVPEIDEADNSLVGTLKEEYDSTIEISAQAVEAWVNKILANFDAGNSYFIKEIGTLKKKDNKIVFEPDTNSILLADNFGLDSVKLPLMEIDNTTKTAEAEKQPEPPKAVNIPARKPKKWLIPAAIILIVFAVGAGLYVTGYMQKGYNKASDMVSKFMSNSADEQLATNDTLQGKLDANELKRKALEYSEGGKDSANKGNVSEAKEIIRYYIIGGSFKAMEKAEKRKTELQKIGYQPEILVINDTIFRVALASFDVRQEAVAEYIKISTMDSNMKIWLYSQLVKRN